MEKVYRVFDITHGEYANSKSYSHIGHAKNCTLDPETEYEIHEYETFFSKKIKRNKLTGEWCD